MKHDMYALPEKGSSYDAVSKSVDDLFAMMTPETSGKLSSTSFWGVSDAYQLSKETHAKFFSWNALFTFQEGAAAKMENDVLDICIGLAGGGPEKVESGESAQPCHRAPSSPSLFLPEFHGLFPQRSFPGQNSHRSPKVMRRGICSSTWDP